MTPIQGSIDFEIPVDIGSTECRVKAIAYYLYAPVTRFHRDEPPEGGVELLRIHAYPYGLDHSVAIEWTDESWVDDLIQSIYRKEQGE